MFTEEQAKAEGFEGDDAAAYASWRNAIEEHLLPYSAALPMRDYYDYDLAFRSGRSYRNAAEQIRDGVQFMPAMAQPGA